MRGSLHLALNGFKLERLELVDQTHAPVRGDYVVSQRTRIQQDEVLVLVLARRVEMRDSFSLAPGSTRNDQLTPTATSETAAILLPARLRRDE